MLVSLDELEEGQSARVQQVGGEKKLRLRLLELGLIEGCELILLKRAPFGDPLQIRLRGFDLTLRAADARVIQVKSEN